MNFKYRPTKKNHSKLSKNEPVRMCIEGCGIEKRGGETRNFKKGVGGGVAKLGQEVGALKRGAGTPYELWLIFAF